MGVGLAFVLLLLITATVVYEANHLGTQTQANVTIARLNGWSSKQDPTEFIRRIKRTANDWRFQRVHGFLDHIFPQVIDVVRLEHGPISTNELAIICNCGTLRNLDVPGPELTADHWRIITGTKTIESLHVNGPAVHIPSLPLLTNLTNLRHLSLNHEGITDVDLNFLRQLQGLTEVSLEGTSIAGSSLANFHRHKDLAHLDIFGTQVTDPYLTNLMHLTRIESLVLGEHITDTGITNILPLTNITHFGLLNSNVDSNGLIAVLKGYPKLKNLNLFHVTAFIGTINWKACPHVELEAAY
ncbi:MAG: hypothetical protein ACPGVU_08610 [Limisphaerales bacterium]